MTLYQIRDLHHCENIQIHLHRTPMYNSVFRFDDEMFVTTHLYGLQQARRGGLADACFFPSRSVLISVLFLNQVACFQALP